MKLQTYEKVKSMIEKEKEIPLKDFKNKVSYPALKRILDLLEKRGLVKIEKREGKKEIKYYYQVVRWRG